MIFGYYCLHSTSKRKVPASALRVFCVCLNLTKQKRPPGINFFLFTKSQALCCRVLATCSSISTSTSSFVATAMSQPIHGGGEQSVTRLQMHFFPPNTITSNSGPEAPAYTPPKRDLPPYSYIPLHTEKDHYPSRLRSREKFIPWS